MNKFYWGIWNNSKNSVETTKAGAPFILPARSLAREYANTANTNAGIRNFKVVRVSLNVEYRPHAGNWTPLVA